MTKKDYEKFAALFSDLLKSQKYLEMYSRNTGVISKQEALDNSKFLGYFVQRFAAICREDNPNFNTQKFINAITKE